ncbi:MAG: hypothetical protein JWP81_2941 [Ferruginibacter sp.]|nr:hypothetical protein [Ferruginibacter sp.]
MKHLQFVFLSFFLFSLCGLKAQQNHFIYVQTDNRQPFYVKLDSKLYSSSSAGYLVVPKLKAGAYNLAIGFPKSEWPEQNLVCTIDQNDIGYLLKNFDDKGWGLLNLQTSNVVMAAGKVKAVDADVVNKTDAFSNMLSNVVNDSTIRQAEAAKAEEKKASEIGGPILSKEKDSTLNAGAVAVQSAANAAEVTKSGLSDEKEKTDKEPSTAVNGIRSVITRSLFNKSADGTEMVFIDESNGRRDTVRVFIPVDKNSLSKTGETPAKEEKVKEEPKPAEIVKEEKVKAEPKAVVIAKEEKAKAKDSRFLEIDVPAARKSQDENKIIQPGTNESEKSTINKVETSAEPAAQKATMINSDCKNFASEEDFLKLRKKMVANNTDDDMISLAKKMFKSKCFTVEQVKNLSVLFLKDAGKYAFFDMAYPFVSDSHNFSTLQNQLSEPYYISRFQVMIRH